MPLNAVLSGHPRCTVIDRAARTRLGEMLRHRAAGVVTNDQFEDRSPWESGDPAIREIRDAAWQLYSDLREHRLEGADRLTPGGKAAVARCVLFLQTDLEYEYPVMPRVKLLGLFLANLCTLGLVGYVLRRRSPVEEFWPFFRRDDLEVAKGTPRLLAGTNRGMAPHAG